MPKLKVTIDIFSGRPNPEIELTPGESGQVMRLLAQSRRLEKGEPGLPPTPTLGYRGLIVEQIGKPVGGLPRTMRVAHGSVFGPRAPRVVEDEAVEEIVLKDARLRRIGPRFPNLLAQEIDRFRKLRLRWPYFPPVKLPIRPLVCRCAPLYEPTWWNDGAQRQLHNNCYNYASNYRTDNFRLVSGGSQPGAAAGAMYTSLTGPAVLAGAVADGLNDSPSANNKCPGEGHLAALVIAPGIDFHWYRKGRTGRWTHKPGSTPVVAVDNSSKIITDPRTADRGMYTEFTTFMVVMHGHVKIK